jgi:hypothetical protein
VSYAPTLRRPLRGEETVAAAGMGIGTILLLGVVGALYLAMEFGGGEPAVINQRVVKDRWGEDLRVGQRLGAWFYWYDDEWFPLVNLVGKETIYRQLPGYARNRSRKVARRGRRGRK